MPFTRFPTSRDMPSSEKSSNTTTRPVKRVGRSIHLTVQVICFLIVIIATNYLSCARHQRFDLTEKQSFTLSDTTKQYLHSDTVQKRETPLKIIAVMRRTSPHYSRVFNLLEEYERVSRSKIELELVDPIRQTDRTLEIENTYKQPYTEDMILVDARPITPDAAETNTPESTPNTSTTQPASPKKENLNAHIRTHRISNLFLQDQQGNITAWQDEDIITSSIIGAIEGQPRRIYFAADKIDLEASQGGDPSWQNLFNLLWQQNVVLTPLRLVETTSIPKDAEGFALIGPQYDLSAQETKVLKEYWDRPKSALLITLDPQANLPQLRTFLREYGITPQKDRIMTVKDGQTISNVQALFTRGAEITQALGGKSTIFEGSTSSLEVMENDTSLLNRRVQPLSLIQAVDGYWGETKFQNADISYNEAEDNGAPLYLAAAVIRGNATSDETVNLVSKMVVIANNDFLSSQKTRPEQSDFMKSSVNWLIGREDLIGIGPKKLHRHKITLLDSHDSFISQIILIFLPIASLLTAMILWNMRRS